MERYKFEDLISDYIENKLPVAKRKEVEAFMEDNPAAKKQMESIRLLMNSMKHPNRKQLRIYKITYQNQFIMLGFIVWNHHFPIF